LDHAQTDQLEPPPLSIHATFGGTRAAAVMHSARIDIAVILNALRALPVSPAAPTAPQSRFEGVPA